MSKKTKKPAPVHPTFEAGQRVRLTADILRHAQTIDLQYITYDPPIVWFAAGETGWITGRYTNLENYWWVVWGDEPPTADSIPFPVHAWRLELIP